MISPNDINDSSNIWKKFQSTFEFFDVEIVSFLAQIWSRRNIKFFEKTRIRNIAIPEKQMLLINGNVFIYFLSIFCNIIQDLIRIFSWYLCCKYLFDRSSWYGLVHLDHFLCSEEALSQAAIFLLVKQISLSYLGAVLLK